MRSIPITVVGGYLGAGKTTLLNALLAGAGRRRIGVVVNDFGELGIDASLVAEAVGDGVAGLVNLANGCVCCTLGDDLGQTLAELAALEPALDDIVIEASGVADPRATAAWGTVAPFTRGAVVVLAAADAVRRQARDRYVGGEVRRQLAGADLLVVTKADLVEDDEVTSLVNWLSTLNGAPCVVARPGAVPDDLVLGSMPITAREADEHHHAADALYDRWSFVGAVAVADETMRSFVESLPSELLRLKGFVELGGGIHGVVNVVGDNGSIELRSGGVEGIRLEAIGVRGRLDIASLDQLAVQYLGG